MESCRPNSYLLRIRLHMTPREPLIHRWKGKSDAVTALCGCFWRKSTVKSCSEGLVSGVPKRGPCEVSRVACAARGRHS